MILFRVYVICMSSAHPEIRVSRYCGSHRQPDIFQAPVEITVGQTREDRKVRGKVKQVHVKD